MFHSENAQKAQLTIDKFRETNQNNLIWIGINPKDMESPAHATDNPFAFSDGTEVDGSSFVWKWDDDEPFFNWGAGDLKCVYLKKSGKMACDQCHVVETYALCRIEEDCVDATSESERSRANLSVLAVFVLCGIFKTFSALVGPAF